MNSARKFLPILILVAAMAVAFGGVALARHARPGVLTVGETGHTIREPFLSAYHDFGGSALLGDPIIEDYTDGRGVRVQYFQNARLEQTSDGVELGALGIELGLARPLQQSGDTSEVYFRRTDHTLDPAFEDFYAAQGGEDAFGAPISPSRTEDGLLLQDFERARLVLDPALPKKQQVRLGELGAIALAVFPPADPALVSAPDPLAASPPAISVSLSVAEPTLQNEAVQTIYLHVVTCDDRDPIADTAALVVLTYEDGTAQVAMPPTGENGISSVTVQAPPAQPGTSVMVEAHVIWGDTVASASTIYLQWW
jgi:hypothetical protein